MQIHTQQQNIVDIDFTINAVRFAFRMSYDPGSPADRDMMNCMNQFGCPEPEVIHLMTRVVRPGDFVIDGGANIGFFTLILSRLVGGSGNVAAVEPAENNLFKLKENLKINDVHNFQICDQPLWSSTTNVTLHYSDHPGFNTLGNHLPLVMGKKDLQSTTLSRWTTIPRLIKLDLEGSEEHALRGAQKLLVNHVPYIVCELNVKALQALGSTQESLRRFMREWGYSTFALFRGGELPWFIPEKTSIFESADYDGAANILFASVEDVSKVWPRAILRMV
jgi:FkbM family methyltransferase